MHRVILGFGLLALASATTRVGAATGGCAASTGAPIERFHAADCLACWQRAEVPDAADAARARFRLDWIVPAGNDAPLAEMALAEAAARAKRAARPNPRRPAVTPLRPGSTLAVSVGPAWYGYLGVQVEVDGRWPSGSRVWLALVEQIDAGSQGNASARALVRALAGPLPLPGPHLHALRLPMAASIERLQPRAWVEAADGGILAMASPACARR